MYHEARVGRRRRTSSAVSQLCHISTVHHQSDSHVLSRYVSINATSQNSRPMDSFVSSIWSFSRWPCISAHSSLRIFFRAAAFLAHLR